MPAWLRRVQDRINLTHWQLTIAAANFSPEGIPMYLDETTHRARALDALLYTIEAEAGSLRGILPAALDAQYVTPPVPRPHPNDGAQKPPGAHGDPTADTATDALRLDLSAAIGRTERLIAAAAARLGQARADLTALVDAWESPIIAGAGFASPAEVRKAFAETDTATH